MDNTGRFLVFYKNNLPHLPRYIDTGEVYEVTGGGETNKLKLSRVHCPGSGRREARVQTLVGPHIAGNLSTLDEAKAFIAQADKERDAAEALDRESTKRLAQLTTPKGKTKVQKTD